MVIVLRFDNTMLMTGELIYFLGVFFIAHSRQTQAIFLRFSGILSMISFSIFIEKHQQVPVAAPHLLSFPQIGHVVGEFFVGFIGGYMFCSANVEFTCGTKCVLPQGGAHFGASGATGS